MVIHPVGLYSALICGGNILRNYLTIKQMFLAFWACVKKNLEIIFGIDSLTEIDPLRLLAGWRERRMDLSSVRNLMSEPPYSNCIGCNLKENEVI